jgi:hypothetical protein
MWRRVVWQKFTDVSYEYTTVVYKVNESIEQVTSKQNSDGSSTFFRNVDKLPLNAVTIQKAAQSRDSLRPNPDTAYILLTETQSSVSPLFV